MLEFSGIIEGGGGERKPLLCSPGIYFELAFFGKLFNLPGIDRLICGRVLGLFGGVGGELQGHMETFVLFLGV